MPTLNWNGPVGQGQTLAYSHPRELKGVYPTPPLQPLASWSVELAAFQLRVQQLIDATTGEARRQAFLEARAVLELNHMQAATTDCPGGTVPAALTAALKNEYGANSRLPAWFAQGTWIT